MPVPQKWIGSSIGIAIECGLIPKSDELNSNSYSPFVFIFDWGRSTLINEDEFNALSPSEQKDRYVIWQ